MKRGILILMTFIYLSSCSESDKQYLNKVSDNLSNISTVEYTSTQKSVMEGQVDFEHTFTISFDFKNDNPNKIKYHFYAEELDLIFNGFETYISINEKEIITTSKNNDPEKVNKPLLRTLSYLRNILPKLINNEGVSITRERDTTINSKQLRVYSFLLEKSNINPLSYDFIKGENDSEYMLYINKSNDLPYKIITPNGKNGFNSSTFDNIKLNVVFDQSLWKGEKLPKHYARFTEEEYYNNKKNKMLMHVGKFVTNWELPDLNDNSKVDLYKLKGNVVLLDFWFKGCAPCRAAIPDMNRIASKYAKYDFKIYGVEFNERFNRDILLKYINDNKVKYPVLYEGKKLALNYGISSAPTFMIIDKQGKIIHIKIGFTEEHIREIEDIINKNI